MGHPTSWARSYNYEVNSAYDAGVIFNTDIKLDMARELTHSLLTRCKFVIA